MKLTIQQLKDMKPGEVIATGTYLKIVNEEIKWVAIRGLGYYDWAIYCLKPNNSVERIIKYGNKITNESIIKLLVPCLDEAFGIYRF